MSLRVGIIGTGAFGTEHARALRFLGGPFELYAAADLSTASLRQFCKTFGCRGERDYQALLTEQAVDAVCITAPNHLHAQIALEALDRGKPVLIEKPMAITLEESDRLVEAVQRTGVPFMVAQPAGFISAYVRGREMIESGAIGEPVYARSAMIKAWDMPGRRPWQLQATLGGGMWLINGVHLVDRLSWLLGSRATTVAAKIDRRLQAPMDADDVGIALYSFESGAIGVAEAVAYTAGAPDHWTTVYGTNGALRSSHAQGLQVAQEELWQTVLPAPHDATIEMLAAEWQAFAKHVAGAPSPVSAQKGRDTVAAVLAALDAGSTGTTVAIRGITAPLTVRG